MKSDEAKPLQFVRTGREMVYGKAREERRGYGKNHEHSDSERAALHVAHSIAVCEVERLQPIIDGR